MRLNILCFIVILVASRAFGQEWQTYQLTSFIPGQIRECASVADTSGHIHHFLNCYLIGGSTSRQSIFYLRTDFYGNVLTDTVALNGSSGADASPIDLCVVGDGEHAWCLFSDYIYGQGNRKGLYLAGRGSDGQEVLPTTLVMPNAYALRAALRRQDNTIHIIRDGYQVFGYSRITIQGDTLLWSESVGPLYSNPWINGFQIGSDGRPLLMMQRGYEENHNNLFTLVRFGEDTSQAIFHPVIDSSRFWYVNQASMDPHNQFHLIAAGVDTGVYYFRLDSALIPRETYYLTHSLDQMAIQSDSAGNFLMVWNYSTDLHWAYRRSDGSWPHLPAVLDQHLWSNNLHIVTTTDSALAFTFSGNPVGEDYSQLWLYTYGVFPHPLSTESPSAVVQKFSFSAYPNPFNSTTTIRFDLLKREKVKLDLYDVQGRLVCTLCDEVKEAGRHEVRVYGEGMASGVYFVRLKSAGQTNTQKILLLK